MIQDYTKNNLCDLIGVCFDYAINFLGFDLEYFCDIFSKSKVAKEIENGNPKYLIGKSGCEVCKEILSEFNLKYKDIEYVALDKSREYWMGYSLGNYVYIKKCRFSYAFSFISVLEYINMYAKYHQMDNTRILEEIEKYKNNSITNLKRIRESNKLSQSQLSTLSGVSIRTIQAYEQRSKDINKAESIIVFNLAKVLSCTMEDLLER